ncbi:hypothetical protein AB0O91_19260 [Kitasatospora sp. NPDC089797]|uniref:hypothetical protein n=1 Tax=Kitasatospora sp. NPDC089797 TaxID=3155298 RepID=UPI0034439DC5
MNELRFRGGDVKADRRRLLVSLTIFTIQLAALVMHAGWGQGVWMIGASAVLLPTVIALLRRGWTVVGDDGIRVSWGLGRVRSYPWRKIRWMAAQHHLQGGTTSVRITLTDGRRRTLPGINKSFVYPDPHFESKLAQIRARWERQDDESFRLGPPTPERLLRRLRGVLPGILAGLGALLAVPAAVGALDVRTGPSGSSAAEDQAALIWALTATVLFAAWCIAVRRAPRGRYPWWAPLSLPGLLATVVIGSQAEASRESIDLLSYWPAVVALLLGPALGYAVIAPVRAARRRRQALKAS